MHDVNKQFQVLKPHLNVLSWTENFNTHLSLIQLSYFKYFHYKSFINKIKNILTYYKKNIHLPLFLVLWLDFFELILTKVADHHWSCWCSMSHTLTAVLLQCMCIEYWPNGIWKCENKHTGLTKMHNANKIISTKNKTGAQLFKNPFLRLSLPCKQ